MRVMTGACIVFLFLMQMSCRNETKTAIIPVDSMKLIMWDMMKADEWFNRKIIQDTNAIRNKEDVKLYEMVFKIHGVSRERYFASYRYYEGRPVSFKRLLDSLDALSNRERLKRYEIERGQPKK
ncbi:DUF4296 domain-containing protein [Sediminibacterium sp.]|jgi:hypothetical protein|uniref:DUF4296 domain-containing protein n=1 Tax=Sediminibacterium sp. TaxID=1917865 RepID=UPI00343AC075